MVPVFSGPESSVIRPLPCAFVPPLLMLSHCARGPVGFVNHSQGGEPQGVPIGLLGWLTPAPRARIVGQAMPRWTLWGCSLAGCPGHSVVPPRLLRRLSAYFLLCVPVPQPGLLACAEVPVTSVGRAGWLSICLGRASLSMSRS